MGNSIEEGILTEINSTIIFKKNNMDTNYT